MKTEWEYTTLFTRGIPDEEELDVYGSAGWELVSMTEDNRNGFSLIFKRPK